MTPLTAPAPWGTLGAWPVGRGRTEFRVWAPRRSRVDVALESAGELQHLPLARGEHGLFEGEHPAPVGARYRYRLDGGEAFPDPCSRFQPEGPHGPSEIVDPGAFRWTDQGWRGLSAQGQVFYELHVGAYTKEGTYRALEAELPRLRDLGVTALELMPVHTVPGRFNWGYDGVSLFAPTPAYGPPDALRQLVDRAHALGLGVLLDVVYNHLGPDGNYLAQFSDRYFSDRHPKEWGDPLNFDGEDSAGAREFVLQNAASFVREYHLDGLRVDATQSLHDASPLHIAAELTLRVRAAAAPRQVLLVAENEPQDVRCVRPVEEGGWGMDGQWVDDLHHTARVAASGNAEAYCQDYRGSARELLACALRNGLYQGQWYGWQKKRRGSPLRTVPPQAAVFYLQNHDQVANSLHGARLHVAAGEPRARALTAFWLLLPQTPLLFMGQEWFAPQPFLYFVDHQDPNLQQTVTHGREEFLSQFPSARRALHREHTHPPSGEAAFRASRLQPADRDARPEILAFHRELLRLRREESALGHLPQGAALDDERLVLRWDGPGAEDDRLLLFNFGRDLPLLPCSEPLLAARPGQRWAMIFSSEESRWGGRGAVAPDGLGPWTLPGQCTVLLRSEATPP